MSAVSPPGQRHREGGPTAGLARVWSYAFVVLAFFLLVNAGAVNAGLPGYRASSSVAAGYSPLGTAGLLGLAFAGTAVLVIRVTQRRMARWEMLATVAIALLTGPAIVSSQMHDGWQFRPFGQFLAAVSTVAVGSELSPYVWRRLVMLAGSIWAWASIVVGLLALFGVVSSGALTRDESGRYEYWAGFLGLHIQPETITSLAGLSPHRQTLGAAMAMVVLVQMRSLVTRVRRRETASTALWLGLLGTTAALLWTLSRTSLIALAAGLVVTAIPLERFNRNWLWPAFVGGVILVATAPLWPLLWTNPEALTSGTYKWRLMLWQAYASEPTFDSATGRGPLHLPPLGAGHAHNLLMEVLTGTGLIGVLGALGFVVLSVLVALSACAQDSRISIGLLVVFAVIGMFEIPASVRDYELSAPILILCLALGAAAAAIRDPVHHVQEETAAAQPPMMCNGV